MLNLLWLCNHQTVYNYNLKLHVVQGPGFENCCQLFPTPHRHSRSDRDEGNSRGNVPWDVYKVYKILNTFFVLYCYPG